MNNLREVGASRVRRMPPPQLLDDIRTAGRHRLRVAAASGVVASILLSIGIAVGVTGVARAGGGDRLTPQRPPAFDWRDDRLGTGRATGIDATAHYPAERSIVAE
jgi:hypothetical protein